MSCGQILNKDIAFDCEAPQQGGIKQRIIVINLEDWLNATVTVDGSTKEITAITLAAGGIEGYEYEVAKSSQIIATKALRPIDGVDGYDHSIDCRINSIEELDARELAKLRFQKVVVIVELLEGRARLYGGWADATPEPQGVGLRLAEDDDNIGDAATGGTMRFLARTPENDPPAIRPPHLIDKDVDLDALLTPTA